MSIPTKPLSLAIPAAAVLLGCTGETAYQRIKDGSLPRLPIRGRWRISVAALEKIVGRELTADEINAAKKIHAADRGVANERQRARRVAKKSSQKEITP